MKRSIIVPGVLLFSLNVSLAGGPSVDAGPPVTVVTSVFPVVVPLTGSAPDFFVNGNYSIWCRPWTVQWWKEEGPQAQVDFADAASLWTTATFYDVGVYKLRLCVSYDCTIYAQQCSGQDTVTVTILLNQCPVVEAGPPITTTATRMPGWSVGLEGTAYDPDHAPDAGAKPVWSGPAGVVFDDPFRLNTSVSFDNYGVYELSLTYDDGACAVWDTVMVTINEPAPPGVTTVQGTVTEVGTGLEIQGAHVWFTNAATNSILFEVQTDPLGFYQVIDPALDSCDLMSVGLLHYIAEFRYVSVTPGVVNVQNFDLVPTDGKPIVDAGPSVTYTTNPPVSALAVQLNGSVEDPDGMPIRRKPTWSQTSGPGTATFDDAWFEDTGVHFSDYGSYVLTLTYDDGEFVVSDSVTIKIEPAQGGNECPTADAGPASMTATVNVPLALQGSASDPDHGPQALTVEWSKSSGPGTVTFQDKRNPTTTATFSAVGTYVLRLWCNDGACDDSDTVSVEVTVGTAPAGACEPLVYLSLDETSGTITHDLSGHGYNGTLLGGPRGGPLWVAGYEGGGLKFDGKDDYVDTQFRQNLSKWTICGWVSSPAAPAATPGTGPIHREQNFQINWNHNDPKFRSAAGLSVGGTWYAASFGTLGANTWHHLAATYDGVSLKAYRNGQLVTTTFCPGIPTAESNSLKLARHAGQAQCFAGTIDEVYVYPCALSENEIKALMSKGVMSILEVADNGTIGDQQACRTSLDSTKGTRIEYTAAVLNLYDSGTRGHFGSDESFGVVQQGRKTAANVDNLSLRAEGVIRISAAQAGNWTFGVNSDDGFTLLFPGRNFASVTNGELYSTAQGKAFRFFGGRALADTLGVINLPAGDHPFWLTYHEAAGGAAVEFFAAKGTYAAFDPDLFRLVGQKDIGKMGIPGFCDQVSMLVTKPGANGAIDSLAKARAALTASERTIRTVKCQFVNHIDPDTLGVSSGTFGGQMPFPNDVLGKDDNEFAVKVTGLLDIPADGVYQIGFNSDDGASLRITGKTWQSIVADGTGKAVLAGDELIADVISGNTFTAGQITLTKGCHAFEAVMFEHDGGSYFELFGRGVSDRGLPDPTWRLLRAGGAKFPVDMTGLPLVGGATP